MSDTFENLDEVDKFQEKHNLSKQTQEEIENQNRFVTIGKCDQIVRNLKKKKHGSGEFY